MRIDKYSNPIRLRVALGKDMMKNMDQQEELSQLTREALDDVDAGKVIDHQSMQSWADSLEGDICSLFDQLPIAEIKAAIDEADNNEFASDDAVRDTFKKWNVNEN